MLLASKQGRAEEAAAIDQLLLPLHQRYLFTFHFVSHFSIHILILLQTVFRIQPYSREESSAIDAQNRFQVLLNYLTMP